MLYVLSEVHSTASSSGAPLIVRLSYMSEAIEQYDCANTNFRSSADDSIKVHRSGGSSSKRKDPGANCLGESLISTSGIIV